VFLRSRAIDAAGSDVWLTERAFLTPGKKSRAKWCSYHTCAANLGSNTIFMTVEISKQLDDWFDLSHELSIVSKLVSLMYRS
jgi:hypothetical protein